MRERKIIINVGVPEIIFNTLGAEAHDKALSLSSHVCSILAQHVKASEFKRAAVVPLADKLKLPTRKDP